MRKLRVYLVDDHTIFTESLQVLLETRPDYVVVGRTGDCRSAIEEIKRCRPDLVLMDISMPGMSGIEATRKISKILPRTRVIALTMHKDEAFVVQFLQAGGAGYLVKDTDAQCLFTALEAVSKGGQFLSPSVADKHMTAYLQTHVRKRLPTLSPREREVLKLIAEGRTRQEISNLLNISVRTLDTHRTNIMLKLNCKSTAELVHYAVRKKLVELV